MADCDCPLVKEVQILQNENKRIIDDIKQLKTDVKRNEHAYTHLTTEIPKIFQSQKNAERNMKEAFKHLEEKLKIKDDAEADKFEGLKQFFIDELKPLKDGVSSWNNSKWKVTISWSILVAAGTGLLGLIFWAIQFFTEKHYTEDDKREYYEKRIKEADYIKDLENKIKELGVEK